MTIELMYGDFTKRIGLPVGVVELQDILDRTPVVHQDTLVTFRFCDFDFLQRMRDTNLFHTMTEDLYLLNEFITRYEDLSQEQKIAFAALVQHQQPENLSEACLLTKGLDSVPMIPAYDHYELGRYCIEHEQTPEVQDCPAYVRPCLNFKKIGKLADETLGGVFLDGYYCDVEKYVCPDQSLDVPKSDGTLFRLLIGTPDEYGDENAQWLTMPCAEEDIYELERQFDMGLDMLDCYRFESALPTIQVFDLYNKEEFFSLNALAKKISKLDTAAFLKYKAVLEAENVSSIADAAKYLEKIDDYHFSIVADKADYAREYLIGLLPEGFDKYPLFDANLHDLGRAILERKGAAMTGYGAVLKGGDLYAPLMEEGYTQTEEMNETMGGISQ